MFIQIKRGLLTITSCLLAIPAMADMTVNVGGRIQADAAFYDEDFTELSSGTEFRRVRLFASGNIDEDIAYKVQLDFADGDADLKDVYIKYTGFDFADLTVGNFKVPFGLEELTSSKYITFMERSMANSFTPSRRIGLGLSRASGNTTFSAAIFGDEANDSGNDEGIGLAGRFTIAPQLDDGDFLHFGAAAVYQEADTTDAGTDVARFRARPESHVTSRRLIDTGTIADVSNTTKLGLEAAAVLGSFSLQAEYILTQVDAAGGDVDLDGYYAYASWFPGGERRAYKNGVFGRTKATNAWELGLRYSFMSLNDGAISGGEETNITLGANYYINPYFRLMANYIVTDVEGGINGDEDPSIFQIRASIDFK